CFFSSRRRHTRLVSDWSSDVCSSDLMTSRLIMAIGGSTSTRASATLRTSIRSEERRVGEEGRSRWAPDYLKKKKKIERLVVGVHRSTVERRQEGLLSGVA